MFFWRLIKRPIPGSALLWSNWCEYKYKGGTEFGEYAMKQYRYAKEYYRLVKKELDKREQ